MSEQDVRAGEHSAEVAASDVSRREPVSGRTMMAALLAKMANVRVIGGQTGADVGAAERERY